MKIGNSGASLFFKIARYLTLYLALRMREWDLRVASLKEMAALFLHLIDHITLPKAHCATPVRSISYA